ncbi:restriction endonuclease [Neptuniibacter sp. QD34_54]|uniref:restriction endonuclease n=1 Tax=Neptuniibacter sp. QD34_54 TaxID=3398208 RepID=UPI0039F5E74E
MGKKKKIFISHNYQDQSLAEMLKESFQSTHELEADWLSDVSSEEQLQRIITSKISSSSTVIALVGDDWSRRQEFETEKAYESGKPILAILKPGATNVLSPIIQNGKIPIVSWNYNEIDAYLTGEKPSLEFQAPKIEIIESPEIKTSFSDIYQELTEYLIRNPKAMYELEPRKFEELIAYIMQQHGYEVELTQQTRDGGVDIYALKHSDFGSLLTIVDCKKYSENHPVGVSLVREMIGTMHLENASHSMIVTSSRFTKDSTVLAEQHKYKMSLKGHADILTWMRGIKI